MILLLSYLRGDLFLEWRIIISLNLTVTLANLADLRSCFGVIFVRWLALCPVVMFK